MRFALWYKLFTTKARKKSVCVWGGGVTNTAGWELLTVQTFRVPHLQAISFSNPACYCFVGEKPMQVQISKYTLSDRTLSCWLIEQKTKRKTNLPVTLWLTTELQHVHTCCVQDRSDWFCLCFQDFLTPSPPSNWGSEQFHLHYDFTKSGDAYL